MMAEKGTGRAEVSGPATSAEIMRDKTAPATTASEYCMKGERPCIMVIFGASGDLTSRMLIPALYSLDKDDLLPDRFAIVGFSRTPLDDQGFRAKLGESIKERFEAEASPAVLERFLGRLHYVAGEYDDPQSLGRLKSAITSLKDSCGAQRVLYYLSVPPTVAEQVLETMKQTSFVPRHDGGETTERIMVEKPFGLDLDSAIRLDKVLSSLFDEQEVYRVDHYLGKDTIRNLLMMRFANSIFEPLWNRRYVDSIQITGAESIGIEGRGGYYEEAGIVRDMVQNHILQVLSLIAMDPPVAGDAESVRDKKLEVLKSVAPIAPGDYVFGQYEGYKREKGVAAGSDTPTFIALRLWLNNWRWFGVPVYIRAGKALASKFTEVTVVFKQIPLCVLDDQSLCGNIRPNAMFVRIQPDEGIRLAFSAKVPGRRDEISTVMMNFSYSQFGRKIPDAYERVLLDGLCGMPTLFWRADAIETAWRIVTPLLEPSAGQVAEYAPGGWGPAEAEELLRRDGRHWVSSYS